MNTRKTVVSIAAVAATIAGGTAVTLGQDDSPSGPGATAAAPAATSAKAVAVAEPSSRVAGRVAARAKRVSVAYFETKKPLNLKPGQQYFKFKGNACPRASKAVDGYMFYGGDSVPPAYVVPAGDAPSGARNWQFYLSNPNQDTAGSVDEGIKFGIICAKNVG
jgi:hypothetical protein